MAKTNKFLDFVSDEDFLAAVQYVQVATKAASQKFSADYTIAEFTGSAIDPFKMLFDIHDIRASKEAWIKAEIERQLDKTLNNKIGEFHQILLGKVNGWRDLGVGDASGIDLAKEDNSIFIELKNKYNTMNSSATEKCGDKLMEVLSTYPAAKAYWCYVVPSRPSSGELAWSYRKSGRTISHANLYKAWGDRVYQIVTGNPGNLMKAWKALNMLLLVGSKGDNGGPKIDRDVIVNECVERIVSELGENEILEYFYKSTFSS